MRPAGHLCRYPRIVMVVKRLRRSLSESGTSDRLYGKPELPAFKTDAWYVLAASLRDKPDAQRLAAIINHQGPPIPARVLSEGDQHRVLAGPFDDEPAAEEAARRLKIDLELDAVLFET